MVRVPSDELSAVIRSPHPRGDGPPARVRAVLELKFSPPAWGWSGRGFRDYMAALVLPTRVGMVRSWCGLWNSCPRSPHPRGDGPCQTRLSCRCRGFSPPAWGWSVVEQDRRLLNKVLPTRVGMVRAGGPGLQRSGCSPHPRGDGPVRIRGGFFHRVFSPPAWGWSVVIINFLNVPDVLPTRVGMVRRGQVWGSRV